MPEPKTTNVWDGLAIRTIPEKEAKKLIKEDKAEEFGAHMPVYRTRDQFTGYNTREMKPGKVAQTRPPIEKVPAKKKA
jgi:hypothetical protein